MSLFKQLVSSVSGTRQFRSATVAGICGKLLIAFIGATSAGLAVAAPSDCAGTSLDGQAAFILPTYAPTVYSYCVQTGFATPENTMANCSNSLGCTRPYTSSRQLESILNCAVAPNTYSGPAPWAAPGQTIVDGNLCWTITAAVVNGVDVRGWARTNPNKSRTHTRVYDALNRVQQITGASN